MDEGLEDMGSDMKFSKVTLGQLISLGLPCLTEERDLSVVVQQDFSFGELKLPFSDRRVVR